MGSSAKDLEAALRNAVEEIYRGEDQNNLTVRFVRDRVESKLGLDQGFFLKPEWKDKSKALIKSWATQLIDQEELGGAPANVETKPITQETKPSPVKKLDAPAKKDTKRAPRKAKQPPRKRQKKEDTPSEDEIRELSTEGSDMSDFDGPDDSEASKSKRKMKSKPGTRVNNKSKKRARADSDESSEDDTPEPSLDSDEDSEARPSPPKKPRNKAGDGSGIQNTKIESDGESDEENKNINKSTLKSDIRDDNSDSEAAMMIDEMAKQKQKRRSKGMAPSSKPSKPKAVSKDLSPDEAQIKTLQSHLTKCGVRKIWGIELKKFGDDNQKKIKHLQGMLRDAGMTGRFSEQRAREIKELRELQADLEAVTEGDSKWGMQSGKRVRAQRKSLKEISDGEDEDGDEGELGDAGRQISLEGSADKKAAQEKAARAKQDLAFLGDEDSDSD